MKILLWILGTAAALIAGYFTLAYGLAGAIFGFG